MAGFTATYEAHARPTHRFADRFGIIAVVLPVLAVGATNRGAFRVHTILLRLRLYLGDKRMKLEKIAPLAEIISSVAVVVTLIYLAVQTQQTNSALVANSQSVTMLADLTLISALIANPEQGGNKNRPLDELTEAERDQVGNVLAGFIRTREFAWLQYQAGILDEATLASYMETPVRWLRDYEAVRYSWEPLSAGVNPGFRSYVNSLLDSSD